MIRAVAVDDGDFRQLFRERETFGLVLFHDRHVRADVGEHPGKVLCDAAAAKDAHAADGRHGPAHRAQHARRLRGRADDVHAVARLRDERAVRHDDLFPALGRAHEDAVGIFAVVVDEGLADKAVALFGLKADELDKAAGKRLHAERRRHPQNARNFLRGGIFGVDDHIKPDLAAQDRCIAEILGVAYAGDRVLRAELFRHQAADEVDLVVFRNGDEKVRLAHARLQKDAGARAVALHTHDVEHGVNVVEHGAVAVDDDQIVVLARHLLGDGVADLTDTDNDDFHFCVSPKFSSVSAVCCLRSTIKTLLNSAPIINMTEARYSHKSNTTTAPSAP